MKYAYEDLSARQFEDLIVFLCMELFGVGTQKFSTGPDGGRDAKFVGRAERFPSAAAPWNGITIIQAKHTEGFNKRFSDSDFFGNASSVIATELPRITHLKANGNLDNYILFSNRRLGGQTETAIRSNISDGAIIDPGSVHLCGVDNLEDLLKRFPAVAGRANLDSVRLDSPLLVSPEELAEFVEAFAAQREALLAQVQDSPPVPRTPYATKNTINNMSGDFARKLREYYLKDTPPIKAFLADPVNDRYRKLYESVAEEFQLKIVAHRKEYQEFDRVFDRLYDILIGRDSLLLSNRRLTRTILFYLYWNCDIGKDADAATE